MSRIGKNPIEVPDAVDVAISGQCITVKGKLGELSESLHSDVKVEYDNNVVTVLPANKSITSRKMWGTTRSILNNLVVGVSEGFDKKLEIYGVGYRAQVQGNSLQLSLGFSHDIIYEIPSGIKIECTDQTHIIVSGLEKQRVGQIAAEIRDFRPPEPYKGKGIRYADEYVVRKEGKKK